ncbi:replication initiation protein, partial [Staphylococcus aureus]
IRLCYILQTKFKDKALEEIVYSEYDKVKSDVCDRRNMRFEFNPNKLSSKEMLWLKLIIRDYLYFDCFTSLVLSFVIED